MGSDLDSLTGVSRRDPYRPRSVACADKTLWVSLVPMPDVMPMRWDTSEVHVLAAVAMKP